MTPFRFKLEKVLDFRRQAEDQAKMALASARRKLAESRERLAALEREREEREAAYAQLGDLSAADLWLWRRYRERLVLDIGQAVARIKLDETNVERARLDLVARATDRKLLEKLKQQQATRHVRDDHAQEQKDYDELSTIRHGREAI